MGRVCAQAEINGFSQPANGPRAAVMRACRKRKEGRGPGEGSAGGDGCPLIIVQIAHASSHAHASNIHIHIHIHMQSSTQAGARYSLSPLHSFHAVNDSRGKPCFRFGDCWSNWAGAARFGRRLKNFQKFPGLLLTLCKRLPTSYLPHLTSTSHPPPTYPIPPRPLRECGPVHFLAKKSLFLRPEEEVSSTSEEAVAADSIPRESLAASIFFFLAVIAAAARSCPPRLSVRPPVVSVSLAQHSPNLPACLAQLEVSFCASAVGSTQHPVEQRLLSSDAFLFVPLVVSCRLSALKFSVLSQGFREPRAPRDQAEPRVVFGTHS